MARTILKAAVFGIFTLVISNSTYAFYTDTFDIGSDTSFDVGATDLNGYFDVTYNFSVTMDSVFNLTSDFIKSPFSVAFLGSDDSIVGGDVNLFGDSLGFETQLSAGDYTLVFAGLGASGSFSGLASISPVPEPHEWAMMLIGLCIVGYFASRQRKFSTQTRDQSHMALPA